MPVGLYNVPTNFQNAYMQTQIRRALMHEGGGGGVRIFPLHPSFSYASGCHGPSHWIPEASIRGGGGKHIVLPPNNFDNLKFNNYVMQE